MQSPNLHKGGQNEVRISCAQGLIIIALFD